MSQGRTGPQGNRENAKWASGSTKKIFSSTSWGYLKYFLMDNILVKLLKKKFNEEIIDLLASKNSLLQNI